MSYTEFLRTKLASQQKVMAVRKPTDASVYTRKQRMAAVGTYSFVDGTSVGTLVKQTDRPVFNNAAVSSKKQSGKVPSASDFTTYAGSRSSALDIVDQARNGKKNLLCYTPPKTGSDGVTNVVANVISTSINVPYSIAFDSVGNLYVANNGVNNVTVYNPSSGALLRTISLGIGPSDIAFDSAGNLYVSISSAGNVTVYNSSSGVLLNTISAGMNVPVGLAFHSSGNLYVCNLTANNVTVYDSLGALVNTISLGTIVPTGGLAFDSAGNLYVASFTDNNVTVYDSSSGVLLNTISGGMSGPGELAFDSAGNLYVANFSGNNVTVYDVSGAQILSKTISAGVFQPFSLAFDSSGNLYVAGNNNVVTVYNSSGSSAKKWSYASGSDSMRSRKCADTSTGVMDSPGAPLFQDNTISLSAMHPQKAIGCDGNSKLEDANHIHSPGLNGTNSQPYAVGKPFFMANPPMPQAENTSPLKVGSYYSPLSGYVENKHGYVKPTSEVPKAPGPQGQEIAHLKINKPTLFNLKP